MFAAAFALFLFAIPSVQAALPSPERREAGVQERASFDVFYRQRYPQALAGVPLFDIRREPGRRDWRVSAWVDGAPYRGVAPLCRMSRSEFLYDARAPREARWSEAGAPRQFAWIDRASCASSDRKVELWQRIPDAALIPLIQQRGALLARARLLLAGNTSCAPHRSLPYRLAGIDVGAPPGGKEEMMALVFDSDRAARARVWVKQRGAELNAWNVACEVMSGAQG